jgi:hypothetical protein
VSLATLRSDAATFLTGLTFADGRVLNATPYLTFQINPPYATFDVEIQTQLDLGMDRHRLILRVQVFDQADDETAAQIRLDQLRDPTDPISLIQILQTDWSNQFDYCYFRSALPVELLNIANVDYLSARFEFEVI